MSTSLAPSSAAGRSRQRLGQRFEQYTQIGVTVLLLLIMLIAGRLLYPNFTSGQAILDLLGKNVFLIPLAIGMTFVILSGGIDLSVGAVMALGSVIAASLLQAGWSPALVVPIVLLAASSLGLVVGIMISRFEIQPFIATLAAMFLARGLCLVITDRSIAIDDGFFQSMNLAHINLWEQETVNLRGRVRITDVYTTPSVVIAVAVLVVAFVVLHYSRFGRTVYAVGGSEQSARLMGLNAARTKILVYVISGTCAGLAGLVLTAYSGAGYPRNGIGTELDAIAAVVIGGTSLSGGSGTILGTIIGAFIMSVLTNGLRIMSVAQEWQTVVTGLIIILAVWTDILRRRTRA